MDSSLSYYVFLILVFVVGIVIVKKIASCLIKTIVLFLLATGLALVYYVFYS